MDMRNPIFMVVATAAAAALAAGTNVPRAIAQGKLKVGFVYLGPVGDFGWTYQHEVGRQLLVKELGSKVETTYLENVNEGPDSERAIEQLARSGHKLIFTTSFGYMDPTMKVAKKSSTTPATSATRTSPPTRRGSTKVAISRERSPPRCRRSGCWATSARSRSRR